ncbi:hypothetical protein V8E36_005552 [Tilletia maclaganii]
MRVPFLINLITSLLLVTPRNSAHPIIRSARTDTNTPCERDGGFSVGVEAVKALAALGSFAGLITVMHYKWDRLAAAKSHLHYHHNATQQQSHDLIRRRPLVHQQDQRALNPFKFDLAEGPGLPLASRSTAGQGAIQLQERKIGPVTAKELIAAFKAVQITVAIIGVPLAIWNAENPVPKNERKV